MAKLAEFEQLSEEERAESQNDGNAALYSLENQALRESLYDDDVEVNRLLDKWWQAAVTYLDEDASMSLSKDEYAVFYARLIRLVEESQVRLPLSPNTKYTHQPGPIPSLSLSRAHAHTRSLCVYLRART